LKEGGGKGEKKKRCCGQISSEEDDEKGKGSPLHSPAQIKEKRKGQRSRTGREKREKKIGGGKSMKKYPHVITEGGPTEISERREKGRIMMSSSGGGKMKRKEGIPLSGADK